jgi:DHA1 family bicyclomycin/chloramphenicol resistance-like MFS transporter
VNLVLSCLLSETLPQNSRYQGKLLQSFSLLAGFVKYKRFFRMLIMFAMLAAPYMAYLAVSSFVYVSYFGLTAQEYSYYFAVNSAAAIIGPGLYLWLKKSFANRQIIIISFVTASISGLLVLLAGSMAAITFLLSFLPFTIIESMVRPFSMDILLREVKENVGTAAAMINFMHSIQKAQSCEKSQNPGSPDTLSDRRPAEKFSLLAPVLRHTVLQ